MHYEEVKIQIRPGAPPNAALVTLESPRHGGREEPFNATFSADSIEALLRELERGLLECIAAHYEDRGDEKHCAFLRGKIAEEHQKLGVNLCEALLPGEVGKTLDLDWSTFVEGQLPDKDGLRLRLVFDPLHDEVAPLAALPWELLVRKLRFSEDAVAQSRKATLVRDLETRRPVRWMGIEGPLRILVVVSSPKDKAPIVADDEIRAIREVFEASEMPAEVELLHLGTGGEDREVSLLEIRHQLITGRYHVLHFIGHGGFNPASGQGGLAFVDQDGKEVLREGRVIANGLKELEDLRLVVLCSCSTAALPRHGGLPPFLNVAPALMSANIPAVVAMQFPISNVAATTFSRHFYRSLARAEPVDVAMGEARLALRTETAVSFEWATPVLFTRAADCHIVRRDPEAAQRQPAAMVLPEPQHLGIRAFKGGWGAGMEERCEELFLDLSDAFDPSTDYRLIRDETLWVTDIVPRLGSFLAKVDRQRPVLVELAAHNSIAFMVGSTFEAKSGLDITVRQRGQRQPGAATGASQPAHQDWSGAEGPVPPTKVWQFEDIVPGVGRGEGLVVDPNAKDVALAISVTHDVRSAVVEYLRREKQPVRRVLAATMLPTPGQTAVESGAHALSLALDLTHRLGQRSVEERSGLLHLFAAAPNIFMVLLGQQAKTFGATQLYEHDFESEVPWAYLPSIAKMPPRWRRYQ